MIIVCISDSRPFGTLIINSSLAQSLYSSRLSCISPFSTLEILYDGTVPLCGCDYKPTVVLGNVKNNSLKEIWNNEKFKQMRDLHSSGNRNKISICVGCNGI